jgi:cyanophycinase
MTSHLLAIGGAEDKTARREILARFVALAGGSAARIVVIPAASAIPLELGPLYESIFSDLGAQSVSVIQIPDRAAAQTSANLRGLDSATGIFFTGGDQTRLTGLIGGTTAHNLIRSRYTAGAVIGGTSAGASALSATMIAYGQEGESPSMGMVQLAPGLGLLNGVIIDQHFQQRGRIGRLISAVAFNPDVLGIGIDEDTGFLIGADGVGEVIGTGAVTVIDGWEMIYTNAHALQPGGAVSALNLRLHVITAGGRYDLLNRAAYPPMPIPAEEN